MFAAGGKVGGWWHYCEFGEDAKAHCQIYNAGGLVLYDGVFLPMDGQPLRAEELKLVYNSRWGDSAQFICLADSRILVPGSDFDRLSRFGEWLQGKRSTSE